MSDDSSRIRGKTISEKAGLRNLRVLVVDYPEVDRPLTRAECQDGPRPCPFVSCRHHLYLDVTDTGSLRLNFYGRDVDEIPETCALDVADRGEHTLLEVGDLLGITRERLRQIQDAALRKVGRVPRAKELKAG